MIKFISLLLVFVALQAACGYTAGPTKLTDVDCEAFINESPAQVSCHQLLLPVDHFANRRQTIEVPVLVARAVAGTKASNAVLIPGGGGPGSPVGFGYLYESGEFLEYYQSLLDAGFDVVFADQRGAGLSTPMLACEESIADFKRLVQTQTTLARSMQIQLDSANQCRSRLIRNGINLALFNTQQSAADFLTITDTLDYENWHLLATSYATAIAQAMLLSRSEGFASLVLDSPVPLDYQQPLSQALIREGIRKTVKLCTARQSCSQRYPDIATKFDTVLARASRKPYKVKIVVANSDSESTRRTLVVDDHMLAAMLFTAVYTNQSIQQLPKVIDQLYDGLVQALNPFAEEFWYQGVDPDYADGLYLSVHCRERLQLEAAFERSHPELLHSLDSDSLTMLDNQRKICEIWQVGEDDKLNTAKIFSTPTLLLAGRLDPIISEADIANTADNFNHIQIVNEAASGHAVWYQSACARKMVTSFLTAPNAKFTPCYASKMRFD